MCKEIGGIFNRILADAHKSLEGENDEEKINAKLQLIQEANAYCVIWTFFDYFVIFENDIKHILTLREFYYNHIYKIDSDQFNLFDLNPKHMSEKDRREHQLRRCSFLLKCCDFIELSNVFSTLEVEFRNNHTLKSIYANTYEEFSNLFRDISNFCKNYDAIIIDENTDEYSYLYKNVENFK
jgi:hypothetical protein